MSWKGKLENDIPVRGMTQWRQDHTLAYKQTINGTNVITTGTPTGAFTLKQFEPSAFLEMTLNSAFANTFLEMGRYFFPITLKTTRGNLLAPDYYQFSADFQRARKTFLDPLVEEVPIHDRWKYLVSEDFDTSGYWNTNADIAATPFLSVGDSIQTQLIPWDDIQGDWESDTDLDEHLSGTQCLLNNSDVNAVLVAGWDWWENYVVEAWCRVEDAASDGMAIIGRYNDMSVVNDCIMFGTQGANTAFLWIDGADDIRDTNMSMTISTGAWYHFKMELMGHRIKCYINGTLIFDRISKEFVSGRAGVWAQNNNTYFDNFKVTLLPPTNFNLPTSVDWTNQYTHASINTAYGDQQKLIAPDGDTQFKMSKAGEDCVLYLPMNEGSGNICKDHSKTKKDGLFIDQVSWVEDNEKGWVIFTGGDGGTTDRNDEIISEDIPLTTGDYTIDFLYNPQSHPSVGNRLFEFNGGTLFVQRNTALGISICHGATVELATILPSLNRWYRLTFMYDGTHDISHVFVDGELIDIAGITTGVSATGDMIIGGTTGTNRQDNAYFKDFRVFNTVRWDVALGFDSTPATVFCWDDNRYDPDYFYPDDSKNILTVFMDEAVGASLLDASGNDHNSTGGTWPAWRTTSARGEQGTCLDFTKTSSHYITFGDHADFSLVDAAGDKPFSISCWWKPDADTADYQGLLTKWDTGGAREYRLVGGYTTPFSIQWMLSNPGYTAAIYITSDDILASGKWYHIVATYDGSETKEGLKLYIDGKEIVPVTVGEVGTYAGMTDTGSPLAIGRESQGSRYLDGALDLVKLIPRELSAEEIAVRYRCEPYLHDWQGMTRVYHKSHPFKGLPVISNGLIMISFPEYDLYDLREQDLLLPCVYAWYENSWHFLGHITPYTYYAAASRDNIDSGTQSDWEIEELTDQYCTIRITYTGTGLDYWPEDYKVEMRLTIRNGFPGVIIEPIDDYMQQGTDRPGFLFFKQVAYGQGKVNRFWYCPEDRLYDDVLHAAAGLTTLQVDDNWGIWLHDRDASNAPSFNVITGFFSDSKLDDLGAGTQWYNGFYVMYAHQTTYGGIFFVPFDVDWVFKEAENWDYRPGGTSNQADDSGTSAVINNTYPTAYWTNNVPYEKGMYMAIFRAKSATATEDVKFRVYNDDEGELYAEEDYLNIASAQYTVYYIPFYLPDSDGLRFRADFQGGSSSIYLDYVLCIPMSNAIDWPSDLAHQAFNNPRVKRAWKLKEENVRDIDSRT